MLLALPTFSQLCSLNYGTESTEQIMLVHPTQRIKDERFKERALEAQSYALSESSSVKVEFLQVVFDVANQLSQS